jgi:acetyltransferase-like isoleucine patch superfamily enzyme
MLDNMEIDENAYIEQGLSKPYDIVLYNPPTTLSSLSIAEEVADICLMLKHYYVWLPPNGDWCSEIPMKHVNQENWERPQFLGILKHCRRFITNSSCADYEAPFVGLKPHQIIRIGERNKNRESQVSDMTIPNASDNIIKILKTLDKKEWEYPVCEHMVTNKYGWCVSNPENFMLEKDTDIGWGTYINASYGVVIEEGVQIGGGCHIYSDNTIDKTHGEVHIGKNATIGAHCVILPDVHIGENAYIPAGAIVSKDVPSNSSLLRVA